jgi:hypothetical protein
MAIIRTPCHDYSVPLGRALVTIIPHRSSRLDAQPKVLARQSSMSAVVAQASARTQTPHNHRRRNPTRPSPSGPSAPRRGGAQIGQRCSAGLQVFAVLLLVLAAIAAFGFWRKILRVVGLLGHNKNKHPFELADWQCAKKQNARARGEHANERAERQSVIDSGRSKPTGAGGQGGGMRDWLRRHTAALCRQCAQVCDHVLRLCAPRHVPALPGLLPGVVR